MKFIPTDNESVVVIAPHLEYPTRNGADILIDRRWRQFSTYSSEVVIVAMNSITKYSNGVLVNQENFSNRSRSKNIAALRTLIFRTHYLYEKFITKKYIKKVNEILSKADYGFLVFSFIWSSKIGEILPNLEDKKIVIETHNDEIQWFRNLKQSTKNPLSILVSDFSEKWVRSFFDDVSKDWIFLHLTEKDKLGYQALAPDHQALIAPVGIEIKDDDSNRYLGKGKDRVLLLFVGALSVKMNLDALIFFRDTYFDKIMHKVNRRVEIHVVGSNPSSKIVQLCKRNEWSLHPNISDDQLSSLYQRADFSILPFPYTTGSKLKLLHSIANNVPFIATTNLSQQIEDAPNLCLFSDDPEKWIEHINNISGQKLAARDFEEIRKIAERYSWGRVTEDLYEDIKKVIEGKQE